MGDIENICREAAIGDKKAPLVGGCFFILLFCIR